MKRITWLLLLVGFLGSAQLFSGPMASGGSKPIQAISDAMILGNISVRSAQNGNIVLIIDNANAGAPDGVPDLVIRFAPRKHRFEHQNLSLDLNGARFFFSDRRVAVLGNDGTTWVSLSLEPVKRNDPAFGLYGDVSSDSAQTLRISKGYALHRHAPPQDENRSFSSVDLERSILVGQRKGMSIQDEEFELEQICNAGGVGSTSCSYTCNQQTCSVSCAGGMYSCCFCSNNQPWCRCRA